MPQTSLQTRNDMDEVIAEVEAYVETLVTEDDTPVDNFFSDYQCRLLVDSLRSSWRPVDENGAPRCYIAATDIAIYYILRRDPIVPDMLLSLDVETPSEFWRKGHRSYFTWEYGKAPDVVVEVVSNNEGNETGSKMRDYAVMGVPYYVIFDQGRFLDDEVLRVFKLDARRYLRYHDRYFPEVGLGVTLWEGRYEDKTTLWLRWCDEEGNLTPTGSERAEAEAERAEAEAERAEAEAERAEAEAERADAEAERAGLLAAKLRELGVDPEQISPRKK